jgi:hypothetical protein
MRSLSAKTVREMEVGRETLLKASRQDALERLMKDGRVALSTQHYEHDKRVRITTVRVGVCFFSDPDEVFPSALLMAKVGLALNAGQDRVEAVSMAEIDDWDRRLGAAR